MKSLDETFGSSNLKWFMIWNIFFLVYSIAIKSSLLSVLFLAVAFFISGHIALKFLEKKQQKPSQPEGSNYLANFQQGLVDLLYGFTNGSFNWLSKILTNCDAVQITLCLICLYAIQKFCYYADDIMIIWFLGNVLILSKGVHELSKPYLLAVMRLKDSLKTTIGSWLPKSSTVK